jgi:hypothetical protein
MYPFWDIAVAPALKAAKSRRIVEIGALRGETTAFMLADLGADTELHVIDPVPVFDPSEHEEQFPGRYIFHRDLSLNVLPDLPAVDAALIDGDHNWYTVFNELRLLSETARAAEAPLPLLVLHDVGWPYGRRDLYYVPEQIPEEFRQPYAAQGMLRGQSELAERGGLNPTNCNATHEGGPRNGVMTAVDDFIDGYDRPLRLVFLPTYFGLAIVVEETVLEAHPALRDHLDWLEGRDGQAALVEMTEASRLDTLVMQHSVYFTDKERSAAAADRYLGLLEGALLNEHYIEQEIRISYLLECSERGITPRPEALRDPARQLTEELQRLRRARHAGDTVDDAGPVGAAFPYTTVGRQHLRHLVQLLDTIHAEAVTGDLVDIGPGRGGTSILFRGYLEAYAIDVPRVWVVDRFRARPAPSDDPRATSVGRSGDKPVEAQSAWEVVGGPGLPELLGDLNSVREGFHSFDLLDDQVRFVAGDDLTALEAAPIERIALLHLGERSALDVAAALDLLYDRLTLGAFHCGSTTLTTPTAGLRWKAVRARHGVRRGDRHHRPRAPSCGRKTERSQAELDAADGALPSSDDRPTGPVLAPSTRLVFPTDLNRGRGLLQHEARGSPDVCIRCPGPTSKVSTTSPTTSVVVDNGSAPRPEARSGPGSEASARSSGS